MNNVKELQVYKWADEFEVLWQQTGRCFRRRDLRHRVSLHRFEGMSFGYGVSV